MDSPLISPVAKAIWEGSIPILFTLDDNEISGNNIDVGLMVEAQRCSYFPLLAEAVRDHFVRTGQVSNPGEIWFAYRGTPLKWHYAIGLLFDILGLQASNNRATEDRLLPWGVTVHFQNYPADILIANCADVNVSKDAFMSMIKEADYLRNGTTKKIMNLSKGDQTQLWEGVLKNDYSGFWDVNHRLVLNDGTSPRHLPVRIYLPGNSPVIQEAFIPTDEQDRPRTLRQILNDALPALFPLQDEAIAGQSATAGALIHGVRPSLETSALWAAQNMAYADNFLHLVIVID